MLINSLADKKIVIHSINEGDVFYITKKYNTVHCTTVLEDDQRNVPFLLGFSIPKLKRSFFFLLYWMWHGSRKQSSSSQPRKVIVPSWVRDVDFIWWSDIVHRYTAWSDIVHRYTAFRTYFIRGNKYFNQISCEISIRIKLWLQFSIQFKEGSVLIKHQYYTFSNIS